MPPPPENWKVTAASLAVNTYIHKLYILKLFDDRKKKIKATNILKLIYLPSWKVIAPKPYKHTYILCTQIILRAKKKKGHTTNIFINLSLPPKNIYMGAHNHKLNFTTERTLDTGQVFIIFYKCNVY